MTKNKEIASKRYLHTVLLSLLCLVLAILVACGSDDSPPPPDPPEPSGASVTGLTVNPTATTVTIGDTTTLTAAVSPETAADKSVQWSSGDTEIATVDAAGVVSGVSTGVSTITATTTDGGHQASCEVTVAAEDAPQNDVTLTISIQGDGSTEPTAGTHTYVEGTSIKVTATAAGGSIFTGWDGAAVGTENPVTIVLNADETLTALFSEDNDNVLPDQCSGRCDDATPVYPAILDRGGNGNVTVYTTEASSGGACNLGDTGVMSFAAINSSVAPGDGQGNWQAGRACGRCAEVTVITSQGPRSVVVRIMDHCPDANCGIDLGGSAPGELMIDGFGRYEGQWRWVSCDGHPGVSDGPPALDVFRGSNEWWSRVLVRNGATAVDTITWQATDGSENGTFPYADDPENTFEVPINVLASTRSSFLITIRYVDGTTASATLSPAELAVPGSYPLD